MEGSKALTREQKFRVASKFFQPKVKMTLLIVQKGAKVIMLPEFTRTLASNSADGFLKFAEEIRDLTGIYDQNLPKITEITLWVGH